MNFLERTMRLMTHLNIAATLATGAWVVYSATPASDCDCRATVPAVRT